MRTLFYTVPPEAEGRPVKRILQRELHLPASMISRIKLRETGICRNGVRCRTIDTVHAGDVISAEIGDPPQETGFVPMPYPLDIRYEDEDLLVLNKPAGMAVHSPRPDGSVTVANALAAYLGTDAPFHPVNRLDKGTSGLMLVAKSGYVHDRLRTLLHSEDFCREYLAVAEGIVSPEAGSIRLPIARSGNGTTRAVDPTGSPARTDYCVVAVHEGRSLLRLRLYTGRTHQIRVHLAALGHPLTGDTLYGSASEEIARPALHSAYLRLRHPVTGAFLEFKCQPPEDFLRLCGGELTETIGGISWTNTI